jgi:CheY-like chemotaxis protein
MSAVLTAQQASPARRTVMVVDDTPENLTLLGEILMPHYGVRVASSGARALAAARIDPRPDLILLDVMMPVMDGYEVISRLQPVDTSAAGGMSLPAPQALKQAREKGGGFLAGGGALGVHNVQQAGIARGATSAATIGTSSGSRCRILWTCTTATTATICVNGS